MGRHRLLSEEDIEKAKALRSKGWTAQAVAVYFGVSRKIIGQYAPGVERSVRNPERYTTPCDECGRIGWEIRRGKCPKHYYHLRKRERGSKQNV